MKATWRKIDGEWRKCIDVGCDDFEAAKQNRKRVAQGLLTEAYTKAEQGLDGYIPEPTYEYRLESGDLEGFEFVDTLDEPLTFAELKLLLAGVRETNE
jgi:hypothetical protein